MNILLWAVAGLLAAAFLGSGLMKLFQTKAKLVASGMGWAEDFGTGTVKIIGTLEVLAAIGLIVPALLDFVALLVPLAAAGLVLLMAGALIVHLRRREPQGAIVTIALIALAGFVAWGRLGEALPS